MISGIRPEHPHQLITNHNYDLYHVVCASVHFMYV